MNIKQSLLGVLEISLYMRSGVARFDNDIKAFWQSFWIIALNIALVPVAIPYVYEADESLQVLPVNAVIWLFLLKFIFTIITLVAFSYWVCRMLNREHDFRHYITASNWTSLTSFILYLPFLFLMASGFFTYMELSNHLFVMAVYIYSLGAYVAKRVLKIPWSLAIAIVIASLAINEMYFGLLYMFLEIFK